MTDDGFKRAFAAVLERCGKAFAALAAHDAQHGPDCFRRPLCPDVMVEQLEDGFRAACVNPRLVTPPAATEAEAVELLRVGVLHLQGVELAELLLEPSETVSLDDVLGRDDER